MTKVSFAVSYIKYWLHARNSKGFGIHSPFLFHLVTEIIHDFTPFYCYAAIEKERQALLENKQEIQVTDLGRGSTVLKHSKKRIADIARYSLKSKKEAQLLFRLINHLGCQKILEIGTSLGISSSYLASVSSTSKVISLEGCPEISKIARLTWDKLHIHNTELLIGDFSHTLPEALEKLSGVDFVFFDGNHQKEATLNYFQACLPHTHNNSVFVFDDIHLSAPMEEAWEAIKKHPKVMVTLDLFHLGIVFFRKELTKQHFNIRF